MKLNSREDLLLHGHEASLRSPRVLSEEAQRAVNLKRHAGERLEQAIMEVARQGYVLLRHGRLLKLLDRIVIWSKRATIAVRRPAEAQIVNRR